MRRELEVTGHELLGKYYDAVRSGKLEVKTKNGWQVYNNVSYRDGSDYIELRRRAQTVAGREREVKRSLLLSEIFTVRPVDKNDFDNRVIEIDGEKFVIDDDPANLETLWTKVTNAKIKITNQLEDETRRFYAKSDEVYENWRGRAESAYRFYDMVQRELEIRLDEIDDEVTEYEIESGVGEELDPGENADLLPQNDIGEKFKRLSPESKKAVTDLIELLIDSE